MKKIVFILLSFCFVFVTFAQKSNFEARIGTNISSFANDEDEGINPKIGLLVGGTFHFKIFDWLYIQPSLLLTQKGAVEKVRINSEKIKSKVDAWYGEIPLHLSFRFPVTTNVNLRLNGGAYYSYGLFGKSSVKQDQISISLNTFEKIELEGQPYRSLIPQEIGISFEAVVEYNQFTFGLGFERSLTPSNDDISYDDMYNINGSLVFGYRF